MFYFWLFHTAWFPYPAVFILLLFHTSVKPYFGDLRSDGVYTRPSAMTGGLPVLWESPKGICCEILLCIQKKCVLFNLLIKKCLKQNTGVSLVLVLNQSSSQRIWSISASKRRLVQQQIENTGKDLYLSSPKNVLIK